MRTTQACAPGCRGPVKKKMPRPRRPPAPALLRRPRVCQPVAQSGSQDACASDCVRAFMKLPRSRYPPVPSTPVPE